MADLISIPQNLFYILIAIIVAVGLIVALMQWKRVRESQSNVIFLEKQAELRKIELVEKDLEFKRLAKNVLHLSVEQRKRLADIRSTTTNLLHESSYLHSEINERVTHLEARTEYLKLQKLLQEIEKQEEELDKKNPQKSNKSVKMTKKNGNANILSKLRGKIKR